MKTNDLQSALAAFLSNNPDLEEGPEIAPEETVAPKDTLHVVIDKKGRNGKVATIVEGFVNASPEEVESLAKELKRALGVGGSFRDKEILIQGNLVDKTKQLLKEKGYKVK